MFLRGETVTNPLPNGYKPYIQPTGPGINGDLFNRRREDQTAVYIFTPVWPEGPKDVSNLKYQERYGLNGEVKRTIADIFGSQPKVTIVPYKPLNTADATQAQQLGTDARGTVLFQYDPNSDGNGQRAWRLFIEARVDYKNI